MTANALEYTLANARWSVVRAKADALSLPFSAPPIPVLEIAENNGVCVTFGLFGEFSGKVAGFCDFQAERLYVNADDPLNRQMFTIAHELGHWILHREFFEKYPDEYSILQRYQKPAAKNPFEQEANHFAANLLVPSRLLKPVRYATVAELASIFSVSQEMMENRLKNV